MVNTMQIAKKRQKSERYSFRKGWRKISREESSLVKDEILNIFGHYSRPFWTDLLYGRKALTIDEMEAIKDVFIKCKIKKSNIWGL